MFNISLGQGTKFKMGDGAATEVFTLVPKMKNIGAVGGETPLVDVSTLEDDGMEYIAGVEEGQEMEITGIYVVDNTDQKAFRDAAKARSKKNFEVEYKNGVKATLNLTLLGFKVNEPEKDQALTFTVKAKQNGIAQWVEP